MKMKKPHEITPILKNSPTPEDFYRLKALYDPAPVSTLNGDAVHRADTKRGTIFFVDQRDRQFIIKVPISDADTIGRHFATMHLEEILFCGLNVDDTGMSVSDRLLAA